MSGEFKVWSYDARGKDGNTYSVRAMLTEGELHGLQAAGIIPESAGEVIGMQTCAALIAAGYELEAHLHYGGQLS